MKGSDRRIFKNEDFLLRVRADIDPKRWDETKYEAFLDELCGHREYQKQAIRTALRYLVGGYYKDLRHLARENWSKNAELQHRYGTWAGLERHLQLPDQLACSLDLATGTGKSFVLYGVALILLAEGIVDRVLVLCPSNTIEAGLLTKFYELATNPTLKELLPAGSKLVVPHIMNAAESITEGSICIENYHAILKNVKSSIRDSLISRGNRVAVLNDEAHHVSNDSNSVVKRWKEFLLDPQYGFRYIVGVSGTCYVGNDYFSDVIYRYSLRQAIEERWVKKIEYIAEMPDTRSAEEKWQLVYNRHREWVKRLKTRNIRPITIVVTHDIATCKQVASELIDWLMEKEGLNEDVIAQRVLAVSSANEHRENVRLLKYVDMSSSKVEWIVSVSMLNEGWDVKNVFQIVPHQERAFNSKLLIAQVLGRGLRRPDDWSGEDPVVTVFNHDAWSSRIKHLVNEILEIERRITTRIDVSSEYNFVLHTLDYARGEDVSSYAKRGEYRLLEVGYVELPTQVEKEDVVIEFERAITGEHITFNTQVEHRTYSAEEVAEQVYLRLKWIDEESALEESKESKTDYATKFPLERCLSIVEESLKRAGITSGRVTDENRQKILQALGPLRRKAAKRVVYTLSPEALRVLDTKSRQQESCSAADLRRGSKTLFYVDGCETDLLEEQAEFFSEIEDPDGEFVGARVKINNSSDFKTPMKIVIADGQPERKFIREMTSRQNAKAVDAWLKNSAVAFYPIEYAWRKGEHPKRGEFSPDFFLVQAEQLFVVEIKDDGEITDPSPDNIKKHEYARAHFDRLNKWLADSEYLKRYQFNMLTPRDFNAFFQKIRERQCSGFRSELDVVMLGHTADFEALRSQLREEAD